MVSTAFLSTSLPLGTFSWPNFGGIEKTGNRSWFGRHLCAASAMVSSTNGLHTITKIGLATAQLVAPFRFCCGRTHMLVHVHNYLKAVDIIPDLNYWLTSCASCPKDKGNIFLEIANAFFTVSDAACTISFASFLGIIDTGGIATTLGSLSIYGTQPLALLSTLSLSPFILSTATVGFYVSAIQAFRQLDNDSNNLLAYLTIISCIAEIAVRVFLLTSVAFSATVNGVLIAGILRLLAACSAGCGIYLTNYATCGPKLPPQEFQGNK